MEPTGFRMFMAASAKGVTLPNIGDAFEGGYYAGLISHTANGVATHALIVAPRATGASGTGYALTTNYQWKTANTTTTGASSDFDGKANTDAIIAAGIASHPAANFCVDLSIGGYTDWYLPARYELDIAFFHLKPTTESNNTSWGINDYSVPKRTSNYSAGTPARTSVSAFQSTGSEAFAGTNHWSSTESTSTSAWNVIFSGAFPGFQNTNSKTDTGVRVRAFRRIAL